MTLSIHVLDTALGVPAQGIPLILRKGSTILYQGVTNEDGRCPELTRQVIGRGLYSLTYYVASYFKDRGADLTDPPFLDCVTIDFGVADDKQHYHVPLLVSPFSYSTYRGS